MFRSWWRSTRTDKHLAALAKQTDPKKMRKLALRSNHEQVHLAAARRLQDRAWLARLARQAVRDSVRLEAARLIGDQAAMAAIALKEWDIERGCTAVRGIANDMLLQRVARSASQDAVRLAAALRLKNSRLLRQVAHSAADIQVRWEIARVLDDPYQLADIAMFKPSNAHMAAWRRKARRALSTHLNRHEMNQDGHALLSFMHRVPYPVFKLEAFLRLARKDVSSIQLIYLAGLDLRYIPPLLLKLLFVKIKACGWHLAHSKGYLNCASCTGKGEQMFNCVAGDCGSVVGEAFPCPDCSGTGRVPVTEVTCTHEDHPGVIFRLPVESFNFETCAARLDLRSA